ncbi:Bifunctional (p)ppGpp synthetase/guanosine-3',5'-bis(diphosphate) 3'-pyrophosphohydrolase [Candidatus Hepatincolaceae symbiont of Richtersius coronifer]
MSDQDFLGQLQQKKDKFDIGLIMKAYHLAARGHIHQKRKSGQPYIIHPTNIALDLLSYNFDSQTIAAALMHDLIEDTTISEEEIKESCGDEVLKLVLGVTNLSKMRFSSDQEAKMENFRKFILAFIGDIRVLIIKIFDRLDNMRTIFHLSHQEKRIRIAKETMDIYIPLAERLSFHDLKDELEDLCFEVLEPKVREFLIGRIEELREHSQLLLDDIKEDIKKLLIQHNINFTDIKGRIKRPYSIWIKMRKHQASFEDIFDILAFRIIAQDKKSCYDILYILHTNYKAIFKRFKDYISVPKVNNYQGLHTVVVLSDSMKIEVQIRTTEMDYFAENGIAAHWNYKFPAQNKYDVSQYSWLRNLASIINSSDVAIEDVYEYSKTEIFTNQIFVFTPKGEVITLPQGSCALDFAYAIHTDIGNKCKYVVIDGINQSIFTKLKNGQKVTILTDENQEPQTMWLSCVTTGVAKLCIKRHLKSKHKKDLIAQAHAILNYMFEKEGVSFYPQFIEKMMKILNIKSEHLFFEKIIEGKIDIQGLISEIFPQLHIRNEQAKDCKDIVETGNLGNSAKKIVFADCCYPIYNDSIVGIMMPGNGIEVHHSSCEILYAQWISNLDVIRIYWKNESSLFYEAKLKIEMNHEVGALASIASILAKNKINIKSIASENIKDKKLAVVTIILEVKDMLNLERIIKKLYTSKNVYKIERQIN